MPGGTRRVAGNRGGLTPIGDTVSLPRPLFVLREQPSPRRSRPMTAGSTPYPLGITLREGGANVAVYSERADKVIVSLFDGRRPETQTVAAGAHRTRLPRLRPGPGPGHALRAPGRRPVGPGQRPPLLTRARCCSPRTRAPSPARGTTRRPYSVTSSAGRSAAATPTARATSRSASRSTARSSTGATTSARTRR